MSDFSLFSLFTAGLACLVPLTAAYTQPKGAAPKGNPIYQPGLNSVVPAGEPFTVTWDPTTRGTVTLVLLKGPSTNAVPQYALVENYPNNGSYVWTPKTNLAPSDPSTPAQGYGIQLIVDATGQYQYTTQFGISNDQYKAGDSSSASAPTYGYSSTQTPPGYGSSKTTTPPAYGTPSGLPKPTWYTKPSSSAVHNVTMNPSSYAIPTATLSTSYSAPTASGNGTSPTGAPFTGGAATMTTGFVSIVFAAGIAVLAL